MRTISGGSAQRWVPIGFSGVRVALQLVLLGQRQRARCRRARRRVASRPRQLLAVERRALEQVGELRAVGGVVERELLVPRAGLDLRLEHHGARTRSPPRRLAASRKPSGCSCSSARWASRLGGARQDRDRLDRRGREAEVEQHRGDRHRRRSSAAACPRPRRRASRNAARERDVRPAHRRARRRARGSARRAGRAGRCTRMAEARAALPPAAWIAARELARRRPPARRRRPPAPAPPRAAARTPRRCRGSPGRSRGCPAATAPCSEPGSAASVIRAATLVGIIPCSAIATSSRSRKKRWSSVGSRAGQQQVEVLGEAQPAHQVAARSRPRTSTRSRIGLGDAADRGPGLADLHRTATLSRRVDSDCDK